MIRLAKVAVGEDETAAYLYWDSAENVDKLLILNGKKAVVQVKVEVQKQTIAEVEVGSYGNFGVYVADEMKDHTIWFTLTFHGRDTASVGYNWNENLGYYER